MPRLQMMRSPNADEEAMKRDALATMRSARTDMLIRFPFLGELAMRLKIVPVLDERLPVACTDGETVYVNAHAIEHPEKVFKPEFRCGVLVGKDDCATAILAHEVWHCALLHFDRRGDMDPQRFNCACDIEIGHLLKKAGIVNLSDATCHEALPGMSAEEIYKLLEPVSIVKSPWSIGNRKLVSSPSEGNTENTNADNASADGETKPEKGNGGDSRTTVGPRSGENSANTIAEKNGDASGEKKSEEHNCKDSTKKLTDGHYSRMTHYPPMRSMTPDFGNKGVLDPDFTPTVDRDVNKSEELEKKWRNAVRKAANRHGIPGQRPGNLPGNLKQVIDGGRKKTLDWKQLLLDFVSRTLGGDRQWLPPSRRYAWKKLYLPRRAEKQSIEIVVAVDTSGSTTGDLPDFLSELRGMTAAFGEYRITIIQCDTAIHSVKEYTGDDPLPEDLTFYGFGGTSLTPPFKYVEKHLATPPNVLIYLTDGYGDAPKYPPEYPVIWCLTGDGEKPTQWGWEVRIKPR